MRNTGAKEPMRQEDVDSGYLFDSFLAALFVSFNGQTNLSLRVGPLSREAGDALPLWALAYTITRKSENTSKGTPDCLRVLTLRHVNAPAVSSVNAAMQNYVNSCEHQTEPIPAFAAVHGEAALPLRYDVPIYVSVR
jgi:hypothetical protein